MRFQLQTLKKGNLSIVDYILQLRTIGDSIKAAGHEISEDGMIMYLLGGLGSEFDVVVINLTTKSD